MVQFKIILIACFFIEIALSKTLIPEIFNEGHQIFALEKGKIVHEIIATDIENGLVVIKMPKHNGLDAMEIMADFKNGWTLRKFVDKNVCHLSSLDKRQFEPPEVLEDTFKKQPLETYLWQNVPNITYSNVITDRVEDFSILKSDNMTEFCSEWPVYLTKLIERKNGITEDNGNGVEILPARFTTYRPKRQTIIFDNCPDNKRKSACVLFNKYCHYISTCEREKDPNTNYDVTKCKKNHEFGEARCCTSCCSSKEQSSKDSPYCNEIKIGDFKCYNKDTGKWIN